jgi:nucleotide-binding universal stress UspA family protein
MFHRLLVALDGSTESELNVICAVDERGDYAELHEAVPTVTSTSSHTRPAALVPGSVSHQVLQTTHAPVLLVHFTMHESVAATPESAMESDAGIQVVAAEVRG